MAFLFDYDGIINESKTKIDVFLESDSDILCEENLPIVKSGNTTKLRIYVRSRKNGGNEGKDIIHGLSVKLCGGDYGSSGVPIYMNNGKPFIISKTHKLNDKPDDNFKYVIRFMLDNKELLENLWECVDNEMEKKYIKDLKKTIKKKDYYNDKTFKL